MRRHSFVSSAVFGLLVILACSVSVVSSASAEKRFDVEIPSATGGGTIPGVMYVPDGAGPFPAVLVLAPGGGVPEEADKQYARRLAQNGFVGLALSYQINVGSHRWSAKTTSELAGAVKWLRQRPEVGNRSIGTVGFSAGSMGISLSARLPIIKAVVVYYGGYNLRKYAKGGKGVGDELPDNIKIPSDFAAEVQQAAVLLLHGEKDDEINVQDAREMHQSLKAAGKVSELVTYPDAYHRFDRGNVAGMSGEIGATGFTYRANFEVAEDAFKRTLAWLNKHLAASAVAGAAAGSAAGAKGASDEPVGPTGRTPSQIIAATDKDGDGRISKAEFKGPPAGFAKIDADGDGFLTKQEMINAWK